MSLNLYHILYCSKAIYKTRYSGSSWSRCFTVVLSDVFCV